MYKYLGIIKKTRPKICTARYAGGTDFGVLYLIVPSYLAIIESVFTLLIIAIPILKIMQNFLQQIWSKLSEPRSLRFLVVGIFGAITNILLLAALVDCLHWETTFLRSLANIMATEICLVASFFAYRQIVWQIEEFDWRLILQTELPTYHLSIASVIAIRSLLLFPFMDWLGIDPVVNTGIGIGIGAILTYTLSEKFIFTERKPLS